MFENFTSSGKLYKKVVAGFIIVTVLATATFYVYLSRQNARRSSADVNPFVSILFDPPTVTMVPAQEYTVAWKFEGTPPPLAAQGYNLEATFNNTLLEITHISYNVGLPSADLGDTDANLAQVNTSGRIRIHGEIASATPQVLTNGTDIAAVSFRMKTGAANFQTQISVTGAFIELLGDNSLVSRGVNPTSFTAQNGVFTPQPTQPPLSCGRFEDIPVGNEFFSYAQCLGCNQSMTGYSCGAPPAGQCVPPGNLPYFLPGVDMFRGQMMKVVALNAGYNTQIPPTQQSFADVPPAYTFWLHIEQAYAAGIISGYTCGGTGEPCDAQNRPYFRPGNPLTRSQGTKVLVLAAGYNDVIPAGRQTFADIPPGSTFYTEIERAYNHNVISGYTCGGTGEPCDAQNRPYFRPGVTLTRSQAAKIVAIGLNCVLPGTSPTPPVGNTTVNMRLKFQGITTMPPVNGPMRVKIKLVTMVPNVEFVQDVDFTPDASGNWTGAMNINVPPSLNLAVERFSLYIKGPRHLKKRVCANTPTEAIPGAYSCGADAIALTLGQNTLNMTGIYQLTGDLPLPGLGQDGLVDSRDTSYIRLHFGDTTAEALAVADLNRDGNIDTQDFSLVIAALGIKYDDPEERN